MRHLDTFCILPLRSDQDSRRWPGYTEARTHSHLEVSLLKRASGSPAMLVIPLLLLLVAGFWLTQPDHDLSLLNSPREQPTKLWAEGPAPGISPPETPPRGFERPPHDRPEGPPEGDRRSRHHGPPPPPCLPPTVIFLIGSGLGYLIGTRQRCCCRHRCQPTPPTTLPNNHPT